MCMLNMKIASKSLYEEPQKDVSLSSIRQDQVRNNTYDTNPAVCRPGA